MKCFEARGVKSAGGGLGAAAGLGLGLGLGVWASAAPARAMAATKETIFGVWSLVFSDLKGCFASVWEQRQRQRRMNMGTWELWRRRRRGRGRRGGERRRVGGRGWLGKKDEVLFGQRRGARLLAFYPTTTRRRPATTGLMAILGYLAINARQLGSLLGSWALEGGPPIPRATALYSSLGSAAPQLRAANAASQYCQYCHYCHYCQPRT